LNVEWAGLVRVAVVEEAALKEVVVAIDLLIAIIVRRCT